MPLLVEIVLITELVDRVGPQGLNYKDFFKKKWGEAHRGFRKCVKG